MKIGIDASRYNVKSGTGVEHYSVKIIHGLIEYFKHDTENSLILYSPKKLNLYKTKNVQHKIIPYKRLWTKIRLSQEMLFKKPDVLFIPSHVLPYFTPKKSIITIHDVAFMHIKKSYKRFQYWYLKRETTRAVKKAYKIIVPSYATKKDLMHFFKCKEDKIKIIPHGTDFERKDMGHEFESEVFNKMGLLKKDNYLLFIGRVETKKNITRLIKAFLKFNEKHPSWKIVIAGGRGAGFNKILKKALKLNAFTRILMPGYITENEKHVLLKFCNAFVFPSLYEGFGIPILEAFAYSKPVITSKAASIPEVAGDAAIYINPHSIEDIQEGLESLIKKPLLKEQTIALQKEQLKKFKWDSAIKDTIDVLLS